MGDLKTEARIALKTGRKMPQAVGHRPLTAEAGDRFHASPNEICVGQSGTGTGLSPSTSVSPSISPD
jgi:hypothetical protein